MPLPPTHRVTDPQLTKADLRRALVIAPGHVRALTSQVDYAPTLLGLLNWSYPSRFFGQQ